MFLCIQNDKFTAIKGNNMKSIIDNFTADPYLASYFNLFSWFGFVLFIASLDDLINSDRLIDLYRDQILESKSIVVTKSI